MKRPQMTQGATTRSLVLVGREEERRGEAFGFYKVYGALLYAPKRTCLFSGESGAGGSMRGATFFVAVSDLEGGQADGQRGAGKSFVAVRNRRA